MTTIATDGRVIVGDGLHLWGEEIISLDFEKIVHSGSYVYGFTGNAAMFRPAIDWFEKGGDPETVPAKGASKLDWTMLVITPETGFIVSNDGPHPMPITFPFAMGKGGEAASAAMAGGLSPLQAVEAVCKRFTHSGGTIREIDIAQALGRAPVRGSPVEALGAMAERMERADWDVDWLPPRRA
jgi:ATP-dependent protease HslVU (ClpYQ) peptidase subunit